MKTYQSETGSVNPLLISNILVGIIAVGLAVFSVWAFMNYTDQKNNVDSKVSVAVASATKTQSDKDEALFLEREKVPTRTFVGLDDFGRVSFQYPKTWSVYIAVNGTSGRYEAYLNPGTVPPVSTTQPFATRVLVESRSYTEVLKSYESKVTNKDLISSPITIGAFSGIRLDGNFTKERKGSVVIFKVRDKTLTIASDADTFRADFDTIILKNLSFNP